MLERVLSGEVQMSGINVLALDKTVISERYVFLYDDESIPEMLETLDRYADDPELSLTLVDAVMLKERVRQRQAEIE